MPNFVSQRIGPQSRTILYLEGTRGSDAGITQGYVVPLRDKHSFVIARPEGVLPYYNGGMQGFGSAPGMITAAGALPCQFEFLTSPVWFKMGFGSGGYTRTSMVTGSVHAFAPPAAPTPISPVTGQIQNEYLEATAQFERARYVLPRKLGTSYANSGGAPFDVDLVGVGDAAFTDLGGAKTENGLPGGGVSVYNGSARMAVAALNPTWFNLGSVSSFNAGLDFQTVVEPVAFNGGVGGSVNISTPQLSGSLALMFAQDGSNPENNFNFLNYAINRNVMSWNCVWADADVNGGQTGTAFPTAWAELFIATARFDRRGTTAGGRAGNTIAQNYVHVLDPTLSKVPASTFGTVVGPYNITTGTNDVFTVKIDGGANITVTLTGGTARTAAQVAADLNANGTFSTAAVADAFNGRVRVTSKQATLTGASSSVQFVTGVLHGCETVLGYNGTVVAGFNAPYVWRYYNSQNVNY